MREHLVELMHKKAIATQIVRSSRHQLVRVGMMVLFVFVFVFVFTFVFTFVFVFVW